MRALAALFAAAAVLILVELGTGALSIGKSVSEDPCTATVDYRDGGIDGAVQRVVLSGLYGAACELGATREELVLSFAPSAKQKPIRWDPQTIERAVRTGLVRAVDDAEARGTLPGPVASVLRTIADHAPVAFLVRGGSELSDLLGRLLP